MDRLVECKNRIIDNCRKVIVGKDEIIELVLACFICKGHVLLEDVPGTGKTMLLRAFAKTIGGEFKRIQFTPDLMPSDVTGINFFNQKTSEFEFRRGPVFSNIILADEINRATPRTQSSLLEAMEERQVSVDGKTYALNEPFMVMATQNPIDSYGTFPLPDAQMDRFFMRLSLGYMTREQEMSVMRRESAVSIIDSLSQVVSHDEILELMDSYKKIRVHDDVCAYIMDIVTETRKGDKFPIGVSTRGAIALYNASQVIAMFRGREFVLPEDVRYVAPHVLCHRLFSSGLSATADVRKLFSDMLEKLPVPVESDLK